MKNFSDRLPVRARTGYAVSAAVLAAAAMALLAGCGGGGGGGSSSGGGGGGAPTPNTEVFSGAVTNTTTSVIPAGYTVRFDNSGPTTISSSTGSFSLTVPVADITGQDTIYALDSNDLVVASTAITNDSAGATGIVVNIGPPSTPPLDKHQ
jgi:hypothetical protein